MSQIRLNKLLADRGICSRREADRWIQNGWVEVDGQICDQLGTKVLENAKIKILKPAQDKQNSQVTILLNKPVGIVSNMPEEDYKEAVEIITEKNQFWREGDARFSHNFLQNLAVAGRLDIDSQGLLVLTQDGRVARTIISPTSEIEKEYVVALRGEVTESKLKRLRHGLTLDDRLLKRAQVELIKEPYYKFVLTEGRNRQIRRMCELVGLEVYHLRRVRVGRIQLGDLPLGSWRLLRADESF